VIVVEDDLNIPEGARHAPATLRNRDAILSVLQQVFPADAHVLEIASGTGEHGLYFTAQQPGWTWQPTDVQEDALLSIRLWQQATGAQQYTPIALNVCDPVWHETRDCLYDGAFCANMIHIAPPEATAGLLKTVSAQLKTDGAFVLYGPFKVEAGHTAPSNAVFDDSLKARDPRWGIRDLGDVIENARRHQLVHVKTRSMPANNLCIQFRKTDRPPTILS